MMPAFFLATASSQGFEKLYDDLVANGIGLVVDIRLPRGFDVEAALRDLNGRYGGNIGYRWLKYFGNPHFDRDDPLEAYKGYLVGMDKELEELYDLIMRHRVCIVDGEDDPARSYRLVLAEVLKEKYHVAYADLTMAEEIVERYGLKY